MMNEEMEDDEEENWDKDELDHASYVCEDCDYRWEEASQEDESELHVCPMCGSTNVTLL